ncbi:MAG: hypothetical protein IBJ03_04650 [Gemmatimonadaceae bacterium]|nr:hypothetical protein [Gemmatimonadaceae bacterium]
MRRVHATRIVLERVARVVAFGAIVGASWLMWTGASPSAAGMPRITQAVSSGAQSLDSVVLRHLVRGGAEPRDSVRTDTLLLGLSRIPGDSSRALLGGLPLSGVSVAWALVPDSARDATLAATVSRVATPGNELLVRSSGHHHALVLRDAGGVLDSVPTESATTPSSWRVRSATWPLTVSGRASTVSLDTPDSTRVRMVRVLGVPGWEYKFTVAALEELGWKVDGAVRVAPTAQVTLGAPATPLDTTRYAAVVVTDSVAVDGTGLQRFVDAGGGLILLGDALRIPALSAMRPAVATERRGGIAGALLTEAPLSGLDAWELRTAPDAVVLQEVSGDAGGGHGHDEPVMVARRRGAGRVLAVAYRELWRWRMEGRDDGIDAHRAWWRNTLSAVGAVAAAPVGRDPLGRDPHPGAGAPYADLVSWIGPARTTSGGPTSGQDAVRPTRSTRDSRHLAPWLGVLALGLLCFEWGSRRLRGAR